MPGVLLPSMVVPDLTERCDRCSAAAKLTVTLRSGGTLAFCGHHANRYAGQIARVAARLTVQAGFAWRGITQHS
jgi:hypothetical protein